MTLVELDMPEEVKRRYEGVAGLAAYRILKPGKGTTRVSRTYAVGGKSGFGLQRLGWLA